MTQQSQEASSSSKNKKKKTKKKGTGAKENEEVEAILREIEPTALPPKPAVKNEAAKNTIQEPAAKKHQEQSSKEQVRCPWFTHVSYGVHACRVHNVGSYT